MLDPVQIENEQLVLHTFRPQDIKGMDQLAEDVFNILSDDKTLAFLAAKRLHSKTEAEIFLRTSLLSFHAGQNYLHFISDKQTGKVIGMIDLISPELARNHYRLSEYPYFIEFYLSSHSRSKGIMSEMLPIFLNEVQKNGLKEIAAIVDHRNIAAWRLLQKSGFHYEDKFDFLQDLFKFSAQPLN